MTPHDDAIALKRDIAARQAFPESRGVLALDRALQRCVDGPRRAERAIGSAFGAAALLVLFGWALGRR